MGQSQLSGGELSVIVRNLGGIEESTVRLQRGVNVLSGRNATNRTSFLRALMGVLGSDGVSLKADAEAGEVTLQTDSETYNRRLERRHGTIHRSGTPYLDDPTLADLFAFLLESNEARRAVSRGENLRALIMRPVDIESITTKIKETAAEKRRVDNRIDELSGLETDRTDLEAERSAVTQAIEETKTALETERAAREAIDGTVDASQVNQETIDNTIAELQSVQSALEETRFKRETERESIETLHAEREEIKADLAALPESPTEERATLEAQLSELRQRQSDLDSTTSQFQSVIQFNEEMLSGTNPVIAEALRADGESGPQAVTDQLLAEDDVVCWTCGSHVEIEEIESTLDRLKTVRHETLAERRQLGERIEKLTTRQQSLENADEQRTELERRLQRTETELETRSERIKTLTDTLSELDDRMTALETTIEDHKQATNSELLEQQTAINQLEFELGRLESDRQQLTSRIETVESKFDERDRLESQQRELRERLTELRTRVDQLEADAVEVFNEHINAVLDVLSYDNIERIWIERTFESATESHQDAEESVFRLYIVRQTADGANYEDTIDHLSESEREVTGLVFALAGYLVHEVHETVPIMILDSLEAIDADRIAALVDYVSEYVETVVVALLPEDAQALDDSYHRVTDI